MTNYVIDNSGNQIIDNSDDLVITSYDYPYEVVKFDLRLCQIDYIDICIGMDRIISVLLEREKGIPIEL